MPFAPISLDEMNKEVLAWDIYQMLAGGPLYDVKKVPVRFTSIDQYLDIFEPLLLEECRAQILRSMGESEPAPHHLKLLSIEQNEPFRLMRFQPPPPPEGGKPHFFETDIVLVSYEPLDMDAAAKRGDGEDEDEPSTGGDFHALGLVASGGGSEHLSIKLHLPSQRTARMPQAQFKRLSMLHRVMVPSSGHWYVQKLGNMVTINREFQALYSMRDLPLCEALLAPGPSRLPASATLKPSERPLRAVETAASYV